jgi:hypothetical protein
MEAPVRNEGSVPMLGPVDYVVLGFKGNNFDGSIMKELSAAVKSNIIRVLDLVFIMKDKDGKVIEGEYEDQSEDLKKTFGDFKRADDTPILSDNDVDKIAQQMKNDTAAGVLVVEHLWAKGLKQALLDAGGFLVADGRVHPEAIEAAMNELATK